jgi:hypothetical protein
MTYQEILQAIESLPLEQQDSLIALLSQQVEQKQNGSSDNTAHFGDSNTNGQSKHDSVEIWEQNTKITMVAPVHCAGWLPNQVHEYLRQVLEVLGAEYGFKKFSSSALINPSQCPIRPCHLLCQT